MSEPARRTRGIVRISVSSILRALYGDTDYQAIAMRISRDDQRMLEITVSHPSLPEYQPGTKMKRIEMTRRYAKEHE